MKEPLTPLGLQEGTLDTSRFTRGNPGHLWVYKREPLTHLGLQEGTLDTSGLSAWGIPLYGRYATAGRKIETWGGGGMNIKNLKQRVGYKIKL